MNDTTPANVRRDYGAVLATLRSATGDNSSGATVSETSVLHSAQERVRAMDRAVAALWRELSSKSVSWLGFYVEEPGAPDDRRLILASCAPKPACSPIGMHGVCGQSLAGRVVRIVRDVAELGADYIACDPRDRSEIVVPLFDEAGRCWGVLDVDSHDVGGFDERDAEGLLAVLRAARLTARESPATRAASASSRS